MKDLVLSKKIFVLRREHAPSPRAHDRRVKLIDGLNLLLSSLPQIPRHRFFPRLRPACRAYPVDCDATHTVAVSAKL
jgi:hypothetical protein